MWIKTPSDPDYLDLARHIVMNMRKADWDEIFATRPDEDREALVTAVGYAGALQWIVGLEEPIAAMGTRLMWPGVYDMWMFATDEIDRIGLSVTKLATRFIIPGVREAGGHRLECRSMEGHHDAQRWLEAIGASREGTCHGYGRRGEDFHVYTWGS